MLFNSYEFLFVFLPVVLAAFYLARRFGPRAVVGVLASASLVFYAVWDVWNLPVLAASIAGNWLAGAGIHRSLQAGHERRAGWILTGAVTANLAALAYYKYTGFLLATLAALSSGDSLRAPEIILPLGVSFFTFTQIAYLVDVRRRQAVESHFGNYLLFVTYFPHLIAGPILHHAQMMPQFRRQRDIEALRRDSAAGMTLFALGLAKKVLLADTVAEYATPYFNAVAAGHALSAEQAWAGALAYTLQLYFDFSGYCDMAIGLSLLFGIRLPLNFNSPYKAVSIIDFWRRWHMTLSGFLRDYLYIALGGNRRGEARRYGNLLTTMLLGGLWHGAGWTFIVWGGIHGGFLALNHLWRAHGLPRAGRWTRGRGYVWLSWGLTFLVVVHAWVFFRSTSLEAALDFLQAMYGVGTGALPPEVPNPDKAWPWIAVLLLGCVTLNNSQQILGYTAACDEPTAAASGLRWSPSWRWALFTAVLLAWSLLSMDKVSEFLYFQF